MYLERFKNNDDIISEYEAPTDALDGADVLLAWYGYGSYSGESLVIFRKDGKLYEVNCSHCSCSGLESGWDPELTSWEALDKREFDGWYDGEKEVEAELKKLIANLKNS